MHSANPARKEEIMTARVKKRVVGFFLVFFVFSPGGAGNPQTVRATDGLAGKAD